MASRGVPAVRPSARMRKLVTDCQKDYKQKYGEKIPYSQAEEIVIERLINDASRAQKDFQEGPRFFI